MGCGLEQERRSAEGGATGVGPVACATCGLRLERSQRGWFTTDAAQLTDYPSDGNDLFFAVEDGSFWFRHRNRVLCALLDRFRPAGALWDIGGGNGYQVRAFLDHGQPAVLVEPGEGGCDNARRRGVPVVIRARLQELELPDEHIAAASFLDVIEHLDDPRPLLEETWRVLEPGGRIFVTVPAYEALWSDADDYAEHKTRYTSPRLTTCLRRAGFEVEYMSHFFRALVVPIALLRTLPYRLRGPRDAGGEAVAEQSTQAGLGARAIEAMLTRELRAIAAGRTLGWGASIVAVAQKR